MLILFCIVEEVHKSSHSSVNQNLVTDYDLSWGVMNFSYVSLSCLKILSRDVSLVL